MPYSAIASDNLSAESAERWYAEGEQAVVNVEKGVQQALINSQKHVKNMTLFVGDGKCYYVHVMN